jgi:DNA-binding GntR family transcriptional regulator
MNDAQMPQYQRIAYDIASRVASGEILVKKKMSGRSLLASEYGVSPETIRRALKLLNDMKVVEIRAGSGVYAISRESARQYCLSREGEEEREGLEMRFRELVSRHSDLGLEILDIASEMTGNLPMQEVMEGYNKLKEYKK